MGKLMGQRLLVAGCWLEIEHFYLPIAGLPYLVLLEQRKLGILQAHQSTTGNEQTDWFSQEVLLTKR
jgi:hypothetical protein